MKFSQMLFEFGAECLAKDVSVWLASVVEVEGSAYRRAGAYMLIAADGTKCGTISAGCLEADLIDRLQEGEMQLPMLIKYNSGLDDVFELNLGCQGAITILLESYSQSALTAVSAERRAEELNHSVVLATIIDTSDASLIGQKVLLDGSDCSHSHHSGFGSTALNDDKYEGIADTIAQFGADVLKAQAHALRHFVFQGQLCKVFCQYIKPPASLTIFGTGDDVLPLVRGAEMLGWNCQIVGWKSEPPKFCSPADYVRWQDQVEQPAQINSGVVSNTTAAVIMTHNLERDKFYLASLLHSSFKYVGIMGPKKRTEKILEEIAISPTEKLHFPIGLDLGAETAEEIALSILAEINAVFKDTRAGFLKAKSGPIHGDILYLPSNGAAPIKVKPQTCS